jgi:hypothetical protein
MAVTDVHPCTFVFNPQIGLRNGRAGHHYAVGSINQSWSGNYAPGFAIAEHTSPVTYQLALAAGLTQLHREAFGPHPPDAPGQDA